MLLAKLIAGTAISEPLTEQVVGLGVCTVFVSELARWDRMKAESREIVRTVRLMMPALVGQTNAFTVTIVTKMPPAYGTYSIAMGHYFKMGSEFKYISVFLAFRPVSSANNNTCYGSIFV